ncbi:MAG: Na/Pi cotransporter family protein [Clostridia bacterium]|nr:Na/Pi cotransporter family protein [Clostridia bacterium]
MGFTNVVTLLSGIALFLFGMTLMGDGLKKVAGSKMELVLYRLSGTPLKGILLGTGVAAVIQSSSATSIMVVGFVNSGMMKVNQAIGIIMGAIIGTSITGWIICLSSIGGGGIFEIISTTTLTALIAVIGIILKMFTKSEVNHYVGDIMLGFAVLMFGISTMSGSVEPLRESPQFIDMMTSFTNPLLGILVGLVFTSIIQSASAAVGILQALAVTGAINFQLALPVIMGIAIGAAVPVLLSALGATVSGERTAFIYLMVDTLGVIIFSILFYAANAIFDFSFMTVTMNMVAIALLNTVFRAVIVAIQAPFIWLLEKIVKNVIKDNEEVIEELRDVDRLEERFLDHPALAIEQARIVIATMASLTEKNLRRALKQLSEYSEERKAKIDEIESVIDTYEDKLGAYLIRIMKQELTEEQNKAVNKYFHAITDFERIGDHAQNLEECAAELASKKIRFTPMAVKELKVLLGATEEVMDLANKAFVGDDLEVAYQIEPLEETIDNLCDEMKLNHVDRIREGICEYQHGFVFNDILNNCERIGDHCSNIGIAEKAVAYGIESHDMGTRLELEKEHGFDQKFEEYQKKYSLD